MPVLEIMGIILCAVIGLFFPRATAAVLAGVILGGNWWWVFGILAVIGAAIDYIILESHN